MTTTSERRPLGLYLHIPFCVRRCSYCDFVSFAEQDAQVVEAYVQRLCEHIASSSDAMGQRYDIDTVFIGGGTPSLLSPAQLERILCAVRKSFVCKLQETTLESNPGTFDEEKLRAFAALGIDRLSIGVQSLNDELLHRLGRIHDSETALRAMRAARKHCPNFNVDLMLGIPGQSLAVWEDTLKRVIAEEPRHISFYSLQLEMGTPFYRAFKDGLLTLPPWSENRVMYHRSLEILKDAGYVHYEISNAALDGFACKHNLKYWTMQDYLGLGVAAHSFLGGRRCFTSSDLNAYLAGELDAQWEEAEERDLKTDFAFTGLRLIEGFSKDRYQAMFGSAFEDDFAPALQALLDQGLLQETEDRIRFSAAGLDQTNPVMEALLNV